MYLKSSNLLFILSQERLRTDLYICEGNYYYQQMQANYSRGVISAGDIHCLPTHKHVYIPICWPYIKRQILTIISKGMQANAKFGKHLTEEEFDAPAHENWGEQRMKE